MQQTIKKTQEIFKKLISLAVFRKDICCVYLCVVRNIMVLPTNTLNFALRIFSLIVTFFLGYLFLNFGLNDPGVQKVIFRIQLIHFEFKGLYLMYLLIAAVGFLAVTIAVSLLSINKVQIDTSTGRLTFSSILAKETVNTSEIKEYFETIKTNPYKTFRGLLLNVKGNKPIQVAGQNVKSLSDLKDYLADRNVHFGGTRKMKFPFN